MPATKTEWLRATLPAGPKGEIGVDREKKAILGMVLAQEGPFKSEGRGEFDKKSLRQIVKLGKAAPRGLKSRFTHPTASDDGLGKMLGRVVNIRMSSVVLNRGDGDLRELAAVRGDLFFAESAFNTPSGDLATYTMDLTEEDPDSISSSLVLKTAEETRLKKDGTPELDEETGEPLPPLWRPLELHASDIVDTGDAVDGLLSFEGLPDKYLREGIQLLDCQFDGKDREFVEEHLETFKRRYLAYRYGEDIDEEPEYNAAAAEAAARARKLRLLELSE